MFNHARHPVWHMATVLFVAGLVFVLAVLSTAQAAASSAEESSQSGPPRQASAVSFTMCITGSTDTSLSFSWTLSGTSSTLRYYTVEYGFVGGTTTYAKNVNTSTSTTVSNLVTGALYWFRVKAVTTGPILYSNRIETTTTGLPPAPSAPSGLSASAVSWECISLQWIDNASNESAFKIEQAASESGPFVEVASVSTGVTSASITGLAGSTAFCYRVCACNPGGDSAYSNTASATTPPTPPLPPSNLTATAAAWARVDLSWAYDSSIETGFRVERALSQAGPFIEVGAPGAASTSYSDTGTSGSTTYYYRVCALNGTASSGYSNTASVTTPLEPPLAPGGLDANAVSSVRIDLSWTDNAGNESGYKVQRKAPDGKSATFMLPPNSVSYCDTGLSPQTKYTYYVWAYNSAGKSAVGSVTDTTLPLPPVRPTAPESLSAVAVSPSLIRLTWRDTTPHETGFIVESSAGNDQCFLETARPLANWESLDDGGLEEGTTYYYRVCAINDYGQSGFTAVVSAETKLNAPTNLCGTAESWEGAVKVTLSWTDNSAREAHYVVQRATSEDGPWDETAVLATLPANTTTYADETCLPDTEYHYRVYATGSISDATTTSIMTPSGPEPINPQWVGKTPVIGEAYWVAMAGNHAYVTSSTGLQVVDISDPANPLVKGSVDLEYPYDVATNGDGYVYVGASKSLKVIDVQDPTSPVVVASLAMPDYAQGVCLTGNRAYVACYQGGLVIVDIANRYSPSVVGAVDTPGAAFSVSVEGSTAVVADSSSILTVDVGIPACPAVLGSIPTADRALDVRVRGGYAYVAASTQGMVVVDVRNPASPQVASVGSATFFGAASGVAVHEGNAYIASFSYSNTDNGLQVFDVSNPGACAMKAFLPVPGRTRGGIALNQGVACMTSGLGGLATIDISRPSAPASLARMPENVQSRGLALDGTCLYTLSYSSVQCRMYVYDVASLTSPVHIGSLDLEYPFDIALDGNGHAVIADGTTLKVASIVDPNNPELISTLSLPDYARGVHVSGSRAYVACHNAGLMIVDISDPSAPCLRGGVDTPGVALAVEVEGSIAVVADCTSVLTVNVGSPECPTIMGSVITTGQATDLQLADGRAYVAANTQGMLVVDVTNPASPRLVGDGVPSVSGVPSSIELSGDRLFATCSSSIYAQNGLQVYGLLGPSLAVQSTYLAVPARNRRSAVISGRTIFLTDDSHLARIALF